jgi:hypothetical protein
VSANAVSDQFGVEAVDEALGELTVVGVADRADRGRACVEWGSMPVLAVIVREHVTRLPLNSPPPTFPVTVTRPVIGFGAHGPIAVSLAVSPPITTRPVVPVILIGPVIVTPQMRTSAAPVTVSGPAILPPWALRIPPGAT